jgi:hypothetical protein
MLRRFGVILCIAGIAALAGAATATAYPPTANDYLYVYGSGLGPLGNGTSCSISLSASTSSYAFGALGAVQGNQGLSCNFDLSGPNQFADLHSEVFAASPTANMWLAQTNGYDQCGYGWCDSSSRCISTDCSESVTVSQRVSGDYHVQHKVQVRAGNGNWTSYPPVCGTADATLYCTIDEYVTVG